jgi:hypothetical protein
VAIVQNLAAAVPGGSTNIGTFTPNPGQLVYFHHVRDLLYKRRPDANAGFFPHNVTDMNRIEIRVGTTPPPANEPEEGGMVLQGNTEADDDLLEEEQPTE